ncbi:MAG: hypothetical protein ABR549_11500 [Mycobacteriales bacterium]
MRELLAHGEVVVVSTDDDQFLGTVEIVDGTAVIRSGYVGRPVLVPLEEIVAVLPAHEHPDVTDDAPAS